MPRKRLVRLYKDGSRNYEISYIVNQRISEEALKKLNAKIKQDIEKNDGAKVVELSATKLISFSYLVNLNDSKGFYVCCYVKCLPDSIKKIREKLGMESDILRILIKLANPKKQSYGIFSPQYNTDSYRNKNKFFSYDDPATLSRFLSECARISPRNITLGKRTSTNSSKMQRSVAREIKISRAFALLAYKED